MKNTFIDKKRVGIVYTSLSFLFITELVAAVGIEGGWIKYIRFLIPGFLFIYFLQKRKIKRSNQFFRRQIQKQILLYSIVSVSTILFSFFSFNFGLTERNLFHIILFLSVPLSFLFYSTFLSYYDIEEIIKKIFWIFVTIFFIELISKGFSLSSFQSIFSQNILTDSVRETESGKSLVFGFFVLFFLSRKNYKLLAISFLLVIIGGKRVAMIGVILAGIIYIFFNYRSFSKILKKNDFQVLFATFLLLIPQVWIIIYSGKYDDLINHYTGVSTDAFLMGRVGIISGFFTLAPDDFNALTGYGLGYVENVLHYKMNYKTNFHNDHLRMYLELGIVFFTLWIWRFFKLSTNNSLAFSLLVLLIILIQTDNVLIYENVMYTFYFILFYANTNKPKKSF